MAARARTPVARRRLRTKARQRPALRYRQTRATIVLLIFIVFFAWLWLVNGDFTASFVMAVGRQPAEVGWAIHVFVSLTEFAPAILAPYTTELPRPARLLLWCLALPFAFGDVLSSAIGLMPYAAMAHLPTGYTETLATLGAEFVSIAPERMIILLITALIAVVRSKT